MESIIVKPSIIFVFNIAGHPRFLKLLRKRPYIVWPAFKDIKMRCPTADGEPPLKYQWLKDGKVLKYRQLYPKYVYKQTPCFKQFIRVTGLEKETIWSIFE